MSFRDWFCQPRVLTQVGLMALIVANLSMRFLHVGPHFTDDAKDGLTGFFYGVAIAALLLGVIRKNRLSA